MKQVIKNYVFNTTARTVTLTDFTTVALDRLALITDVKVNAILYNFADPSVSTATVSGNVITLSALPGGVANTDKLRIDYDAAAGDPVYDSPGATVSGTITANLGTLNGAATATNQATANTSLASLDTKHPAQGQAVAASSTPVVLASDKNVQLGALDVNGNPTSVRTDTSGRLKISHGQPPAVSATLAAVNDQIAVNSDGFSDAIFYFGNPPSGSNVVTFEQSPDSTDGSNGNWFSTLAFNQGASAAAAVTATITTTNATYRVSAPAGSWIRARVSTHTSGSISAQAVTTTAMAQAQVTSTLSAGVTMTSTTIAAPAATIAGLTIGKVLSAGTTNATSTKTTAARLQGWCVSNTTASYKFLKFFNKASAPTVGTDVPVYTVAIPPNSEVAFSLTQAITFATGLAYSITGLYADNDTTAVAAGDVVGAFFYV